MATSTTIITGVQYSGIWNLNSQNSAQAASTWPEAPSPRLYMWGGTNGQGQLGQNDASVAKTTPTQIGTLKNWLGVAAGRYHSVATKSDGSLWEWGRNNSGELGLNDTVNRSSPVQVGSDYTWYSVFSAHSHIMAVKTNGTLWTWGESGYGRLGINTVVNTSSPVQIGALTNWLNAAGGYHSLAVKTDGSLWSWGRNNDGQLGLGDTANRSSPVQVGSGYDWASVSASKSFEGRSYAIKTNGTMWVWGRERFGALGTNNSDLTYFSSPVQVGLLSTWLSVSAGFYHCLALKTDGTLWKWGGGYGDDTAINRSSPVQIGALTIWSKISAGQSSSNAIKTDGKLFAWGENDQGQQTGLNLGAITVSSPVQVGSLSNWVNVANGGYHSIATNTTVV